VKSSPVQVAVSWDRAALRRVSRVLVLVDQHAALDVIQHTSAWTASVELDRDVLPSSLWIRDVFRHIPHLPVGKRGEEVTRRAVAERSAAYGAAERLDFPRGEGPLVSGA